MGRTLFGEPRLYVPTPCPVAVPESTDLTSILRILLTCCVDPWKEENKSGLHPRFPDIDVKYPDTLSPEARIYLRLGVGLPLPSDPELDRLFLDENFQQFDLGGYFTCV